MSMIFNELSYFKYVMFGDMIWLSNWFSLFQNLYDLLMNMLDERGLDEEFAQKLVDFSTNYEHKCYIKFLDGLKDFVIEKWTL